MGATNRVVAGWVLEERLGSGGFGEVWKARRRHAGLLRALKLVPISSEAAFAAWRHEISRLEELSHPHIVRFYDADIVAEDGPYRDSAWIATELCTRSLADELRHRPGHVLDPAEAGGMLEAMLGALAAAHAGGCVHRDVKPANILIHPSGAWKLCDFGTARLIPQGEDHPRTGIVGTFPYMSPAAHHGRQDQAADLYALGVTVHEALTGERLHPRAAGMTDSEYVKLILDTPPRIAPQLEPPWRAVVEALIGAHGPHSAGGLLAWFRETGGAVPPPPGTGPEPASARSGHDPGGTRPAAMRSDLGPGGHVPGPAQPEASPGPVDPRLLGPELVADTAQLRLQVTRRLPGRRRALPPGAPRRGRGAGRGADRPGPRGPVREREWEPPGRRRRRDRGGEHVLGLVGLITASLAVAGALLYTLIPSALAIAAIVGAVLVFLVLVLVFS